jgi:hypothetical protein
MNKTLKIVLLVALVLTIAAGSFYGGMVYGKQQAASVFTAGFPPNGAGLAIAGQDGVFQTPRGQGAGSRFQEAAGLPGMTFGQIEGIEGNLLTITDRNGNTVRVQVAETTLIEKNASVSVADLAVGDAVIISGNPNDDGSITARSVQVAPAGRFLGGGPDLAPNNVQDEQGQ